MTRTLLAALLAGGLAVAGTVVPAAAQDAADFVVRLNRLEGQSRQLSGQVEQLQFENRQLKEQLRKFQEDVEYRLNERGGARAAPSRPPATSTPPVQGGNPDRPPQRRGDAFDPSQNPTAPGAPQQLGTTAPSMPISREAAIPARPLRTEGDDEEGDLPPPGLGAPVDLTPPGRVGGVSPPVPSSPAPSVAATGTGDSRSDYDAAYAYLMARQYERAEMSFRQFIQAHPRDRMVADATYWLGESYLQRNRAREAAEQFLKVSTDFSRSAKAPDAMLKLGVSLNALGARDQACATLAELERKFPQAGPNVRQGAEREQKRARCT